ncbi:MAG: DnaJ domain-containing protein [Clostridia bacterium]|nr:DnaJ domain-containing protein [Clostridia bacterium]
MKDYYAILEINEAASKEVIEKVHKILIKKYHPDLEKDITKKAKNEEKMKEINEAYEVLTDINKKESYDTELKEFKIQEIMGEIRSRQEKDVNTEQYPKQAVYYEQTPQPPFQQDISYEENMQYQNASDEEIRRQAQVYYDELYRQYLRYNGYKEPEDFKTVAKRYLTLFITLVILALIIYVMYSIPYTNELMSKIIFSNDILEKLLGNFFK